MGSDRPGPIRSLRTVAAAVALLGSVGAARADIPFDSPAGLIVLEARPADGPRPLRLLLDTGDPGGVTLLESTARALGIAAGAPVRRTLLGLSGWSPVTLRRGRIGRLTIDGVALDDLEGDIAPADPGLLEALGADVDGFLGAGILDGLRLEIDYPARRLSLRRPAGSGPPDAGGAGDPLRLEGGRLITIILAGGARREALIDTAAAATLADRAIALAPDPSHPDPILIVDAAGRTRPFATRLLPELRTGGSRLLSVRVVPLDLKRRLAHLLPERRSAPAMVLGADLLATRRAVFDLARGAFRLEDASR